MTAAKRVRIDNKVKQAIQERARKRIRPGSRFDLFIFGALLVLIAFTAVPYGTVEPGWQAVFESSVFVLGSLWIFHNLLNRHWRVSSLWMLAPLVGIILLGCFQLLPIWNVGTDVSGLPAAIRLSISADPFETRLFVSKLLALVLAAELLLCYTTTRQRLHVLVNVVIGIGVASALFGLARQTMQGTTTGFGLSLLDPHAGYGQFINRNHFALLMEMALGLLMGVVIGRGISKQRILMYLGLALPIWAALVLSNSRGGILGLLCQVLFFAALFGGGGQSRLGRNTRISIAWVEKMVRPRTVRLGLVLALLFLIVTGALFLGGDPLVNRLESASKEVATGATSDAEVTGRRENINRLEIWRATWRLIKANPITGVGFGGYWTAIAQFHDASGDSTPQQAHNDYLELWASGGPIAVALFGWFVFAVIRRARRQLRSADSFRRAACFGALAALFTVAVHSSVDFGLHITINALICMVMVVIATVDFEHEAVSKN
jgi:O-antigen ligase